MKNPLEMLSEIKNLLGVELSEEKKTILAQLKLENGTVLESDDFTAGKEVFILTEDEQVALPVGEYNLEDGRTLSIKEDGVIDSIEVKAEEEPEEEEKKEEMNYATKEELDEVKQVVEEIKKMLEPVVEDVVEEVVEQEAELKAELSKPAADPIKHNPESREKKKVLYSQKRSNNTLDIVMNKILNK